MNPFKLAMIAAAFAVPSVASAAILTTDANAPLGVALTPPFGPLVQAVGTAAISNGLNFSWGNAEGIFNDGSSLAFCGINALRDCDLLTAVDGSIVAPNSLTQALTDYIYVEAGFAAPDALTLSVWDINNVLLATATLTNPVGVHGRYTASITRSSADIAYFSVSGADTFGVNVVSINAVPEPSTWALLITGFGLVGAAMRRRTAALAA